MHVDWAISNSSGLVNDVISDGIVDAQSKRLAAIGPDGVIDLRRRAMRRIRDREAALRESASDILKKVPVHIRDVLSCIGSRPVNIPLLEELGKVHYPDGIEQIVNDLKRGFQFSGNISVDHRAAKDNVIDYLTTKEQL